MANFDRDPEALAWAPTQTCTTCGDVEIVRQDGRGFPPDIARRRLERRCKSKGHTCQPQYRAGVSITRRPAPTPEETTQP